MSNQQLTLGNIAFGPTRSASAPETPKALGQALADRGAKRAADKADRVSPEWRETAARIAVLLAERDGEVTSETLAAACPVPDGADPRAIGAVFRALSVAGRLTHAGYRKAARTSRHAGPVSVWLLPKP